LKPARELLFLIYSPSR